MQSRTHTFTLFAEDKAKIALGETPKLGAKKSCKKAAHIFKSRMSHAAAEAAEQSALRGVFCFEFSRTHVYADIQPESCLKYLFSAQHQKEAERQQCCCMTRPPNTTARAQTTSRSVSLKYRRDEERAGIAMLAQHKNKHSVNFTHIQNNCI
jgi:hypothetical protein